LKKDLAKIILNKVGPEVAEYLAYGTFSRFLA